MNCGRVIVTRPETTTVTVKRDSTATQVVSKTGTPVVKEEDQTTEVTVDRTAVSKKTETQTATVVERGLQGPPGESIIGPPGPPGPPGKDGEVVGGISPVGDPVDADVLEFVVGTGWVPKKNVRELYLDGGNF